MSPFIRRYAKYLTEKSVSYRTVAFDFCKVKRGKEGGTLRQMKDEKLLKTLPTLASQARSEDTLEPGGHSIVTILVYSFLQTIRHFSNPKIKI